MPKPHIVLLLFITLVGQVSYALAQMDLKDYCGKLKVGNSLSVDAERKKLQSRGFSVDVAVAAEAGHSTQMLMIAIKGKPENHCDVVIRDGRIAEIRQ